MNDNQNKEDFFDTKRGKDLIKLMGFAIFFILVIFYINSPSEELRAKYKQSQLKNSQILNNNVSSSSSSEEKVIETFSTIKNKFIKADYQILGKIVIKDTEKEILLQKKADILSGFYYNNGNKYQIKINNDLVYEIDDQKEVINDELLKGVNLDYLYGKKIMKLTDDVVPIIKEEDNKRIFNYSLPTKNINIHVIDNKVKMIEILSNGDKTKEEYNLAYSY